MNKVIKFEALLFAAGNNSTNSGPRALNTNNRSTNANANYGFRLRVDFFENFKTLPLGKIVYN